MRPRALVIDDDASHRLLCRVNLEAEGLQVLDAGDGLSGLEAARSEEPDVILLAVTMTPLDGWRVAEQLRADPRTSSIPIVFMATQAELLDRPRDFDTRASYSTTKPLDPVDLVRLLRRLFDW